MRRVLLFGGLTACMSACTLQTREPFTELHRNAIVDSVTATLEDYALQVNAGNWDSVGQYYADDPRFHVVEDGAIRYTDSDSVEAALDMIRTSFTQVQLDYRDVRVVALAPGVANVTMTYSQAFDDSTGTVFELNGALTYVTIHFQDGWKILTGHTSTLKERPSS